MRSGTYLSQFLRVFLPTLLNARAEKKRELKGDSVKIASVEFKNRLKTTVLLYYDGRWSRD